MPMYTYQCDKCGRLQDRIVPISERDAIVNLCEKLVTDDIYCDGALVRVPSVGGGGFKLKGRGFHCNDYPKGRR